MFSWEDLQSEQAQQQQQQQLEQAQQQQQQQVYNRLTCQPESTLLKNLKVH